MVDASFLIGTKFRYQILKILVSVVGALLYIPTDGNANKVYLLLEKTILAG